MITVPHLDRLMMCQLKAHRILLRHKSDRAHHFPDSRNGGDEVIGVSGDFFDQIPCLIAE